MTNRKAKSTPRVHSVAQFDSIPNPTRPDAPTDLVEALMKMMKSGTDAERRTIAELVVAKIV